MRFLMLLVAVLGLLFLAGFGGLRGVEQFGASDDFASKLGVVPKAGGVLGDIAEAVGGDNAVADGIRAFASGAEGPLEKINALRRGAVGMITTGGLALLLVLFLLIGSRGGVLIFAFLVVAAAIATWILNPDMDMGPFSGLTQQLVDLGPMSDTNPKTVALLLGGVGIVGAFFAMAAESLRRREQT